MRLQPGDLVGGKYRIVRMIGDGGMGAVYEARHEVLGTGVALKFLHQELARRPGLALRFLQEARVSANIQSPHVIRVTDVEQTPDGTPYLVMELLSGESLQQVLDRQRKVPKDQAIDFALQLLSGLEAAHALGVVHRDLKPDNVFITPSAGGPVCKLLDFGIAKLKQSEGQGLTRPGALMGTPEYMSPEQLYSADRVDHRADLYSVGVMLFEMLAGERPAIGEDAAAIVGNVLAGKVKRLDALAPDLPAELVAVVHRSIAPDKSQRFQTAAEMRSALAPFAGQLSHAGKLAATPTPAGVSGFPPPVAASGSAPAGAAPKPPVTADEPALEPARGGVAPTLPPGDAPAPGHVATVQDLAAQQPPRGATQEASKDLIANLAAQNAAAQAVPAMTASPYAAAGPFPPPQPVPLTSARRRSAGGGLILALLGGLVTLGAIVGGVLWVRQNKDDTPRDPPLNLGGPAPPTTITGQGPGGGPPPPVPQSPPPPTDVPRPAGTGTAKPKPRDAGADAAGDAAATPVPTLPFPIPSTLPPLPSTLPFPIPAWPPPTSSQ